MSEVTDLEVGVGAIGVVCGAFIAMALQRARHPYFWTAACAFLSATLLVALGGFFWLTSSAFKSYPLLQSLIMGIVWSQGFLFMAPFWAGMPALLAGLAAQYLFQRGREFPSIPPSPPLPSATDDIDTQRP